MQSEMITALHKIGPVISGTVLGALVGWYAATAIAPYAIGPDSSAIVFVAVSFTVFGAFYGMAVRWLYRRPILANHDRIRNLALPVLVCAFLYYLTLALILLLVVGVLQRSLGTIELWAWILGPPCLGTAVAYAKYVKKEGLPRYTLRFLMGVVIPVLCILMALIGPVWRHEQAKQHAWRELDGMGCDSSHVSTANGIVGIMFEVQNPKLSDADLEKLLTHLTILNQRPEIPIIQIDLRGGSFSRDGVERVRRTLPGVQVLY